jgi:hypothetical protein
LSFFSWSSCCLPFFDLGLLLSFFLFLFVIVLSVLLWSTASVVLLCFFSWSLCCLSFFDLRFLLSFCPFFSWWLCCLSFFDLRFLLSCCPFSLGDCVVCPSLIYGFCCPVVLFLLVIVLSVLLRSTFLLSCCPFSLGDCVVCPSSIYGFCCPVVIFLFVIVLSVLLRSTVSVVLLSFFSWSLCCQLFLIIPLVSSFTYRSKKNI